MDLNLTAPASATAPKPATAPTSDRSGGAPAHRGGPRSFADTLNALSAALNGQDAGDDADEQDSAVDAGGNQTPAEAPLPTAVQLGLVPGWAVASAGDSHAEAAPATEVGKSEVGKSEDPESDGQAAALAALAALGILAPQTPAAQAAPVPVEAGLSTIDLPKDAIGNLAAKPGLTAASDTEPKTKDSLLSLRSARAGLARKGLTGIALDGGAAGVPAHGDDAATPDPTAAAADTVSTTPRTSELLAEAATVTDSPAKTLASAAASHAAAALAAASATKGGTSTDATSNREPVAVGAKDAPVAGAKTPEALPKIGAAHQPSVSLGFGTGPHAPQLSTPSAPHAAAEFATTLAEATTALPADTAHQIVQAINLQWRRGVGEARIQLEPQQFGHLTVALRVEQGQVVARLEADTPAVREWLQNNQGLLRGSLAEQNLTLNRLEVAEPHDGRDARERGDAQGSSRDPRQQRRQPRRDDNGELFEVVA